MRTATVSCVGLVVGALASGQASATITVLSQHDEVQARGFAADGGIVSFDHHPTGNTILAPVAYSVGDSVSDGSCVATSASALTASATVFGTTGMLIEGSSRMSASTRTLAGSVLADAGHFYQLGFQTDELLTFTFEGTLLPGVGASGSCTLYGVEGFSVGYGAAPGHFLITGLLLPGDHFLDFNGHVGGSGGPFDHEAGMDWTLTVGTVPAPSAALVLCLGAIGAGRRRRV